MTENKSNSKHSLLLLGLITLTGAALRFYNYSSLTYYNDELSALTRVNYKSFLDLIIYGVMPDVHPAGIQVFLFMIVRFFGNSEAVVRFPFVIAGILSIPMVFLIAKKWFNETTGLLAASALAVLQYPVYFSQMARPYSMGMFMCLLFIYFMTAFFKAAEKKTRAIHYFGFILSGAACMYIHYFSFLFAGLAGLGGLFFIKKENLIKYILCGVGMVALASPHYIVYKYQLSIGGVGGANGWLGPPDENAFRNYFSYIFNDSWYVYVSFIGISAGSFIVFRKTLELKAYHLFCIGLFLLPFLIAYFYSIYKNPVFQFSVLIFSFPCLLIFLFSFFPSDFEFKKLVTLISILLVVGGFSTVIEKKYYTTEHYGVFKELAEKTIDLNKTYGDLNVTNTINVFEPFYINYYFEKYKRPVKMAQYRCTGGKSLAELRDLVNKSTTPYFLHAWSNINEPPETEDIIMKEYPYRIEYDNHFNSALSFYSRKPGEAGIEQKTVFYAVHDFEHNKWPNDSLYQSGVHFHSGRHSSNLSGQEYGNTFTSQLKDMGYQKGDVLSISLWVYSPEIVNEAEVVVTIQDKPGSTLFWQAGGFDFFNSVPSTWQQVFFTCTPKGNLTDFSELKIFPWNIKKKNIWIDDLEIRIKRP